MSWRWPLGLALLLLLPLPATSQEWFYTVRPGDELWNVAARYCGSPRYAARIAEVNQLADPARIRPGTRLRIPVEWLVRQPANAEVLSVNGEAWLLQPRRRAAEAGQVIEMGQRLQTAEGFVVVAFADGSTLQVSRQSEVLFNVLTAWADTGMVDTSLRFTRGRGAARVRRAHQGSRFRISTPSGTAAVRGTEFRVGVEEARTLAETLTGELAFQQDQEIALPAGFGLVASPSGATRETLLPAPAWQSAPGAISREEALRWSALGDAVAYRVSVYRRSELLNPLLERLVDGPSVTLRELAPDAYQVAVRGVSRSGLEGFDSRLALELRDPPPRVITASDMRRDAVRLQWQSPTPQSPYVVQVSPRRDFADASDLAVSGGELALNLAPGRYFWRVRSERGAFTEPAPLMVRPLPVARLRTAVQGRRIRLAWDPVVDAGAYRVEASPDPDFGEIVHSRTVIAPEAELDVDDDGGWHLRVTAVENDVASAPSHTTTRVREPWPWWPLPLALLLLVAV